jgi:hypothetical protein
MKKLLYKIVCPKPFEVKTKPFFFQVISEANNIANLHMQISSCDKILEVKNQINFQLEFIGLF